MTRRRKPIAIKTLYFLPIGALRGPSLALHLFSGNWASHCSLLPLFNSTSYHARENTCQTFEKRREADDTIRYDASVRMTMPCLSVATSYARPEQQHCRHPRSELRNLSLSEAEAYQTIRLSVRPGYNPKLPLPSRHITYHSGPAPCVLRSSHWECDRPYRVGANLLYSSSTSNFYFRTTQRAGLYRPSSLYTHQLNCIRVITAAPRPCQLGLDLTPFSLSEL